MIVYCKIVEAVSINILTEWRFNPIYNILKQNIEKLLTIDCEKFTFGYYCCLYNIVY